MNNTQHIRTGISSLNIRDLLLMLSVTLLSAIFISSCAVSSRSKISDAALSGNPTAMWSDGQVSVDEGERLIARGNKNLAEGRKLIREGQELVSKGNDKVLKARRDYQFAADGVGGSITPKQVKEESTSLREIGKRWEDAIDNIRDGNKLTEKGTRIIDKGQAEIREGRELIESGSLLMRNSQRLQRGEELLKLNYDD